MLRTVVETLGKLPETLRDVVETLEKVVETLRRCPDAPEVRTDTLATSLPPPVSFGRQRGVSSPVGRRA
jgi:hypothetical protein